MQKFFTVHLNPYLNFHRPCGFASIRTAKRGRRQRIYRTEDYRTPFEKLTSLPNWERYLKPGLKTEHLRRAAQQLSDTEAARTIKGRTGTVGKLSRFEVTCCQATLRGCCRSLQCWTRRRGSIAAPLPWTPSRLSPVKKGEFPGRPIRTFAGLMLYWKQPAFPGSFHDWKMLLTHPGSTSHHSPASPLRARLAPWCSAPGMAGDSSNLLAVVQLPPPDFSNVVSSVAYRSDGRIGLLRYASIPQAMHRSISPFMA